MTRTTTAAALLAALALAVPAAAQDRPSEDELFGEPPPPAPRPDAARPPSEEAPAPTRPGAAASEGAGKAAEGSPRPEEAELFGDTGPPAAAPLPSEGLVSSAARRQDDVIELGGTLYLRAQGSWTEDTAPARWGLSSPNLVDLYLDARPNDRVRGFVLGRMFYDPTTTAGAGDATAAGDTAAALEALGLGRTPRGNPRAVLDQLWVNFDLGRRVFVTAGKQHVKWGVGKFWNPTDYLHPVRRDPLAVFDARTGTAMVKLHVPWETRGWNFYGVALLEDAAGREPTSQVGRIAAGGRAEIVLGTAELGVDGLLQEGRRPRFGVDVSAGIWELDVYAEAALRTGIDGTRWKQGSEPGDLSGFVQEHPGGFTPQIVAGGSWSRNYTDEDAVTVGAEYFYDDAGYSSSAPYPFLVAGAPSVRLRTPDADPSDPASYVVAQRDPAAFRPFYLGKHYAGAFVSLPRPGRWNDHFFTLSVLGNVSDRSVVARLDHAVLALTYLRVESFVAGHFGEKGGEFRFGFEAPPALVAVSGLPAGTRLAQEAPVLELGIALRVNL
jgi:hypothetical protein